MRFVPDGAVTRAQFVAMLTAALGLPEAETSDFRDVSAGRWYSGAVGAATKAGLVTGFADGTFRPDETITREQMTVLLMRAYRKVVPGADTGAANLARFRDANRVADWAADDTRSALALGIVNGRTDGILAPKDEATRAEAAQLLTNVLAAMGFMNR
jgi:hypothetical protein